MDSNKQVGLSTKFQCFALPLGITEQIDEAAMETIISTSLVVIFPFIIPWRYMVANYVNKRGNRWR